ncbi:MAG: hypothetical protein CMO74_15305 [Verrucomicrobiales bacterium]|nr:hypothetical protein [Verrucomicrobiales bacterium]|tara:strand:+ start:13303 stop:15672 length:2370 start_codon:yes stop_codon:yes gene_type:complete
MGGPAVAGGCLLLSTFAWGAHSPPLSPPEKVRTHWAFQPVKEPPLPSVQGGKWVRTPVDRFVLARLESRGWSPSPRAERHALIRRATLGLTGLPPTFDNVRRFEADKAPDAWPRLVDRLLASPHYGEHWGRHWLDVARYADNKGYVGVGVDRRYPYSYTYRDYVVRSFNEDLPFNRFILEQIAADHLNLGDDKRALAAMGFLTLGRRFLNRQDDIIDDRIDVVTRGFMGLTVTCARCHDHKYDPVPTADYYSLHGVFASSMEPEDLPKLGGPPSPRHAEYLKEKAGREAAIEAFRRETYAKGRAELRRRAGEYMQAVREVARKKLTGKALDTWLTQRKLNAIAFRNWQRALVRWKAEKHPVFLKWFGAKEGGNPLVANAAAGKDLAALYSALFKESEKRWNELRKKHPDAEGLPDANWEAIRLVVLGPGTPATVPENLGEGDPNSLLFGKRNQLRTMRSQLGKLAATHPGSPPRAHVLNDKPRPVEPYIYVRGSRHNRGPKVPRQFLKHLAPDRKPFARGSGRLELAEAIAHLENPLTARVLVNRVWAHHFGRGLVTTPSDFGLRAERPTHPRLLDWLAARFVAEGWSIKKLHRLILLSATYQQSSMNRSECAGTDPDNALLWKMKRQRLSFEAMRDSILSASGQLDLAVGGRPVDIARHPTTPRRTLYGFIDRQNLPDVFRTFDFASPDAHCPERFENIVPQQALFLMNSPFLQGQSGQFLKSADGQGELGAKQVKLLYRKIHQRNPTAGEMRDAMAYLDGAPSEKRSEAFAQLAQVLFLSNEFRFID